MQDIKVKREGRASKIRNFYCSSFYLRQVLETLENSWLSMARLWRTIFLRRTKISSMTIKMKWNLAHDPIKSTHPFFSFELMERWCRSGKVSVCVLFWKRLFVAFHLGLIEIKQRHHFLFQLFYRIWKYKQCRRKRSTQTHWYFHHLCRTLSTSIGCWMHGKW